MSVVDHTEEPPAAQAVEEPPKEKEPEPLEYTQHNPTRVLKA